MGFKNFCVLVHWTKVASALEGLNPVDRNSTETFTGVLTLVLLLATLAIENDAKNLNILLKPSTWVLI